MDISEAVFSICNGSENNQLYQRLIEYMDVKCVEDAKIRSGVDLNVRKVKVYGLNPEESKTDYVFMKLIDKEVSKFFLNYKAKFPRCGVSKIREAQLLKYSEGGKYEAHTDSFAEASRELTCILNLNSDYEGGEFVFWDPSVKNIIKTVENKKGQTIFFPSNFMYPHQVNPITKGIRYSIVIWLA